MWQKLIPFVQHLGKVNAIIGSVAVKNEQAHTVSGLCVASLLV